MEKDKHHEEKYEYEYDAIRHRGQYRSQSQLAFNGYSDTINKGNEEIMMPKAKNNKKSNTYGMIPNEIQGNEMDESWGKRKKSMNDKPIESGKLLKTVQEEKYEETTATKLINNKELNKIRHFLEMTSYKNKEVKEKNEPMIQSKPKEKQKEEKTPADHHNQIIRMKSSVDNDKRPIKPIIINNNPPNNHTEKKTVMIDNNKINSNIEQTPITVKPKEIEENEISGDYLQNKIDTLKKYRKKTKPNSVMSLCLRKDINTKINAQHIYHDNKTSQSASQSQLTTSDQINKLISKEITIPKSPLSTTRNHPLKSSMNAAFKKSADDDNIVNNNGVLTFRQNTKNDDDSYKSIHSHTNSNSNSNSSFSNSNSPSVYLGRNGPSGNFPSRSISAKDTNNHEKKSLFSHNNQMNGNSRAVVEKSNSINQQSSFEILQNHIDNEEKEEEGLKNIVNKKAIVYRKISKDKYSKKINGSQSMKFPTYYPDLQIDHCSNNLFFSKNDKQNMTEGNIDNDDIYIPGRKQNDLKRQSILKCVPQNDFSIVTNNNDIPSFDSDARMGNISYENSHCNTDYYHSSRLNLIDSKKKHEGSYSMQFMDEYIPRKHKIAFEFERIRDSTPKGEYNHVATNLYKKKTKLFENHYNYHTVQTSNDNIGKSVREDRLSSNYYNELLDKVTKINKEIMILHQDEDQDEEEQIRPIMTQYNQQNHTSTFRNTPINSGCSLTKRSYQNSSMKKFNTNHDIGNQYKKISATQQHNLKIKTSPPYITIPFNKSIKESIASVSASLSTSIEKEYIKKPLIADYNHNYNRHIALNTNPNTHNNNSENISKRWCQLNYKNINSKRIYSKNGGNNLCERCHEQIKPH